MSESEETPSQRQARIRRQKREAKINANAQDRLDKITKVSGRTPESSRFQSTPSVVTVPNRPKVRRETPPSTPGAATPTTSASQGASPLPAQGFAQSMDTNDPQQAKIQEDYIRTLLKSAGGQPGAQGQPQPDMTGSEDPMMKMLGSMMGAMGGDGDPNAPPGMNFSPDDLAKATGLPSFVTNMFMGSQKVPPTPEEERSTRLWRVLHVIFALAAGIYLVLSISMATKTFGQNPPAPATFQNPFAIFVIGEILLQSARIMLAGPSGKRGPGLWLQMAKEFAGDGALSVFMLGISSWWRAST